MSRKVVVLLVIIGVSVLVWQKFFQRIPALIPREVLFDLPEKISPKISPDGLLVSYLAPYKKVLNVWLYDRKTKADRVLTFDKER
ncbi:MAG: S9 family peptidase, partial [Candidatus Omnitrophica bacterium]|nr:S9 family peptidase [Candidatus Omnitrophota bacterium]